MAIEVAIDDDEEGSSPEQEKLVQVLGDLNKAAQSFLTVSETLVELTRADLFKILSKQQRNALLGQLLEATGNSDDIAKAAYRQLKKVRRVRPTEDIVDNLLMDKVKDTVLQLSDE